MPPPEYVVRQRVHALLGSPTWAGRWLGVLDDLLAPKAMTQNCNLDWLLGEFPWAHSEVKIFFIIAQKEIV